MRPPPKPWPRLTIPPNPGRHLAASIALKILEFLEVEHFPSGRILSKPAQIARRAAVQALASATIVKKLEGSLWIRMTGSWVQIWCTERVSNAVAWRARDSLLDAIGAGLMVGMPAMRTDKHGVTHGIEHIPHVLSGTHRAARWALRALKYPKVARALKRAAGLDRKEVEGRERIVSELQGHSQNQTESKSGKTAEQAELSGRDAELGDSQPEDIAQRMPTPGTSQTCCPAAGRRTAINAAGCILAHQRRPKIKAEHYYDCMDSAKILDKWRIAATRSAKAVDDYQGWLKARDWAFTALSWLKEEFTKIARSNAAFQQFKKTGILDPSDPRWDGLPHPDSKPRKKRTGRHPLAMGEWRWS